MSKQIISVMLVDDHPVVREGFRKMLANDQHISVVSVLEDGEAACKEYGGLRPDVVVLDLSMPGMGGLEAIRRIRARDSNAKILVFTGHDSKVMVSRALEAGASGYLLKSSTAEQMIEAVHAVFSGQTYLNHDFPATTRQSAFEGSDVLAVLTKREFQVFQALAEGQSVSEIAELVSISPKTVGVHQTNLMKKLHLKNTAELTRLAIRYGIVSV